MKLLKYSNLICSNNFFLKPEELKEYKKQLPNITLEEIRDVAKALNLG